MSTTMTELDRQAAVAVFPRVAAASRRQGRNDRLFLDALHHHLAGAAEALRQMERRVEAARACGCSVPPRFDPVSRPSSAVRFANK